MAKASNSRQSAMAPPPALQKVQDRLLLQVVQSPLRTAVISTMFPLGDCGAMTPSAYADYNAIRPVKRSINVQDRKNSVDERSIVVSPGFSPVSKPTPTADTGIISDVAECAQVDTDGAG